MSGPVEAKVKAAVAGATTVLALVVGILASLPAQTWQGLPAWAQLLIAAGSAAAGAGGAGLAAPHTWRTDPAAVAQRDARINLGPKRTSP